MRSSAVRHTDITPGFTFVFDYDDDAPPSAPPYASGPHMVITSQWRPKLSGGYYEYLCLGPWGNLEWHSGLGRVYIIADPKNPQKGTSGQ